MTTLIVTTVAAFAQAFSPQVEGIPSATGPVTERAVLRSIDLREGTGEPAQPGQEYTIHYTGWLRDGKKFDSSVDRNTPLTFIQGRRLMIPGFDAGFEGMRVGGKRRLFIPYQMAYGEKGRGPIPPKAELIFDVELVAAREPALPDQPALGILIALGEYEKKILALARAIPDEKYDYRPAPAVRPVREVLAHIAYGLRLMSDLAVSTPPSAADFRARMDKQQRDEREPRTKAQLIEMVEASFAAVRKRVEPFRNAQLSQEVTFFGAQTTVQGVYTLLVAHAAEHLGQLIAYARMQGIAPPWSTGAGGQ